MSLTEIEKILADTIGLDAKSIGHDSVRRVVERRMQAVGLLNPRDYGILASHSQRELEELVEGVSIPETWFFRDAGVYDYLSSWVLGEWRASHRGRTLRVLSVPCSTGEEPFSIAIALREAGFRDYQILGYDVRHSALRKARSGSFSGGSFRGSDLGFRDRCFTRRGDEYVLSPALVERVEFRHGNILDRTMVPNAAPFDLIFCRNLMIYLGRAARERVIANVDAWLHPEGLLFSGHAETEFVWGNRFSSLRKPGAFAYSRSSRAKSAATSVPRGPVRSRPAPASPTAAAPSAPPRLRTRPESRRDDEAAATLLREARRLADAGEMDRAEMLCTRCLAEHGGDAETYYLLGLIHQIRGNGRQAEELLRRALELSPEHYEALVSLALTLESRGERSAAAELRERAESSWLTGEGGAQE